MLLVLAVVLGCAAARLRHPLGARATRHRFTWLPALAAGAALNVAAFVLEGMLATLAMGASLVVLLGFVAINAHLTGIVVIGVGLLLNLVAVVANDGMPVRASALVAAGVVEEADLATVDISGARHLERPRDLLPILGDVIPLPLPVAPEVLSFGDLIIVFGAGDAVRDLARRRRRRWSDEERAAFARTVAAGSTVNAGTDAQEDPSPSDRPTPDREVDVREPDGAHEPHHGSGRRHRVLVPTTSSSS